jgi:sodium pump decarboxylase gamma subunit
VTDELAKAATIAVIGVAVVMAALIILMIAVMVITRLVPRSKEARTNATLEEVQGQSPTKESIAAIAVAVALTTSEKEAGLTGRGALVAAPGHEVSRWASAGRERLMHSRRKPGRKWGRTPG